MPRVRRAGSGNSESPAAIDPADTRFIQYGVLGALMSGVSESWFVVDDTMAYLVKIIRGRASVDQLGGPIRIAQVAGQVATSGFTPILRLVALLSVSIGLLNLFPIPLLDGGHLLFYLVEAVRGRPLSERAQEYGFRFGLALVLLLMLFTTYNDLLQLAPIRSLVQPLRPWPSGNALESKDDPAGGVVCLRAETG